MPICKTKDPKDPKDPKSQHKLWPYGVVLEPIERIELACSSRSHWPFRRWWLCHWLLGASCGGMFETLSSRCLASPLQVRPATEVARHLVELFGAENGDSWTDRDLPSLPKPLHLCRHPSIPDTIDLIFRRWSSAVRGSMSVRMSVNLCVDREQVHRRVHRWMPKPRSEKKTADSSYWLSGSCRCESSSTFPWCCAVSRCDSRSHPKGSSSPESVAQPSNRQWLYASSLSSVEVHYASIPVPLEPLEPHIIWAKWPSR